MSIYLKDIPLSEAKARLNKALEEIHMGGSLGCEIIPLDENAIGRVLAAPVWAEICSPHYNASAMDGFGLRAELTSGAAPNSPRVIKLPDEAVYLDTGDPLPVWADAVIPIENVEAVDEKGNQAEDVRRPAAIRIRAAVTPWSHVRPVGEDIVATQLVLPAGHTLRPVDLGAMAACGHVDIRVNRQPRVAVLPTGTELVPPGSAVRPGDIIEYNSLVLSAQVNQWGGKATRLPITPDNFELICQRVQEAARENDLVLLNAGSSAGMEDFSARVIETLGEVLVHGVAVRPGHPVILGVIHGPERSTPIIGVPGYPVSAAMTGEIFVEPLISRWLGRQPDEPQCIEATLTRKITSPGGDDDYLRVAAGKVGDQILAGPLSRGAGVITSLVKADGIVIIPRGVQGIPAGSKVNIRLYRPIREIEKTIFAIGSHDLILDLAAQYLAEYERRLASVNAGSLGGLIALQRGEAHLAGSHLLDLETGEYNLSYVRQYLPGLPVRVVALVGRQQGLLVARGNPKHIKGLADLTAPDICYINRQKGAGTRVLLDYHLEKAGISPDSIKGYNHEEYTHLAVAAAIASGRCDCGMGIAAAAQALNLDFIPLFNERYDLIIPEIHAQNSLLQPLFDLLGRDDFRQAVAAMPGYDVSCMGKIIAHLE